MPLIDPGKKAPAFTLKDQTGNTAPAGRLRGPAVVLYFYPKDDTPGCTKEACAFRDNLPKFKTSKAVVLGMSIHERGQQGQIRGQVQPELPAAGRRES